MGNEVAWEIQYYCYLKNHEKTITEVVIAFDFDEAVKKAKNHAQYNSLTLMGVNRIGDLI